MAGKKREEGKKKEGKDGGGSGKQSGSTTSKKTKVGETFHLDERTSGDGSGQLEASVTKKLALDERARKAIIGYARVDLIENKSEFRFGMWNDRPLDGRQVNRLVQSFLTKGADRFSYSKAIPLSVKAKDLKSGTYVTTFTPGTDATTELPVLELVEEAKGQRRFVAAGGQHRLNAVEQWVKTLEKQHAELVRQRQAVEKQDSEAATAAMDVITENRIRKPRRDALRETLDLGGQWMVILYDSDKIDRALGLHLSENESDHVYRQTHEEGLVHTFRTLKENGKTHRDVEPKEGVTGAPRKWAELLSQDYVWTFMETTEPMGIHMFDATSDMKIHRFHGTMLGTAGGIISYTVGQMEELLCQCFNDLEVDEKKVDRLIAAAFSTGGTGRQTEGREARAAIRTIYEKMFAEGSTMMGAKGAVYAVRQCMDNAFLQHLGPQSDVAVLFANQGSNRWKEAMKNYLNDLIDELPKVVSTIMTSLDEAADDEERASLRTLRWCVAKVKVLNAMFSMRKRDNSYGILPFMSRSVYSHMVAHLEVIDGSLKEFCRWWEPMIDMQPAIGKYWTPGSASAAMARAILCHRDIEEDARDKALLKVIHIIWTDYASFVSMQLQLQEISVPPRISVQKTLLGIFGVYAEGQITKELREARESTSGKKKNTMTTTSDSKGKAKEKKKADASRKKKKKKARTDEDEDDDDEDEELVRDDDSAGVDSAEEDDGEEDEDEDTRAERVRLRHERTMKKHHALVAKHEEWSETHALLVGSKPGGREKHAPVLNFAKHPPSFQKTWKKVSRMSKDRPSVPMRGLALIDWTTWEWKNIPSQSFARIMRTFAAAAIAESSTIISYRHEMIFCHPEGGAATLRLRVQDLLAEYLVPRDPGETRELHQTTLKDMLGSASQGSKAGRGFVLTEGTPPPTLCITWPDGIYLEQPMDGITQHVVGEELARLEREKALGAQQRAVQKAINAVQDLRVAWHDPTSTARARDKPPLDEDVALALEKLVKTLNINAYRQRAMPTRTLAFDSEEAMAPRERLHITIRSDSIAEDRPDNTFVMGVPQEHHLLNVPTKAQSIQHIEDLATKYREWLMTRDANMAVTGPQETFKYIKKEDGEAEEDGDGESQEEEEEEEEKEEDSNSNEDAEGSIEKPGPNDDDDTKEDDTDDLAHQDTSSRTSASVASDQAPPPNQLAIRSYAKMISTASLARNTPPTLDEVEEVDESSFDAITMGDETDVIREFTTLNDDDDNTTSTLPTSSLVPTLPALSPPRPRALPDSRKRERAETMSSATSKEGKTDEHPAKPSTSTGRKSSKPASKRKKGEDATTSSTVSRAPAKRSAAPRRAPTIVSSISTFNEADYQC